MSFRSVPPALAAAVIAGLSWFAVPPGNAEAAALPVAGPASLVSDTGSLTAVRYHHPYGYRPHYRHHGHYRAPYPYWSHHRHPHRGYGHRGYHHGRHWR